MKSSIEKSSLQQSTGLRVVYTALIFLGQFSLGMVLSILAASMVDFRYLMGDESAKASISAASVALQSTVQAAGAALGSALSFTYKMDILSPYLNRQLFTAIFIILGGISFTVTPYLHSIALFCGLSVITGVGLGNMSVIANAWLIEMWSGRRLAVILQVVQLCSGLGNIFGPLLIRSHLHGFMNATKVEEMSVEEYKEEMTMRREGLVGTFIIVGCIILLVGIAQFILYMSVIFRYHKPTFTKKSTSSEVITGSKLFESSQTRTQLYLFIVFFLAIFAANNLAETILSSFQETFYQSLTSMKVTASQAAGIASLASTGYTVGRIISILLSMVLSAENMLLIHFGIGVLGYISLLFTTQSSLLFLQINATLIGYSRSPLFPAMYAFVNTYSTVDDRRNAMIHLAMNLPASLGSLLMGQLIERTPSIFIYFIIPAPVISATAFGLARFWLIRKTAAKEKTGNLERKSELTK